jgi:S-adenosylmethionine:tRNA ribosyltransferase-isomerase
LRLSDFDFHLPESSIAQEPPADRSASRMLVIERARGAWQDRWFRDLPQFIHPGDCLVFNNSKVFPARLVGTRAAPASGAVEVFLLQSLSGDRLTWSALVHPGRRVRVGEHLRFGDLKCEVIARGERGERTVRFDYSGDIFEALNAIGRVPLPPYIKRAGKPEDRERYQTIYARHIGSVAAPTAGLHFTPEVVRACRDAGAELAYVTLHIGLGTFQPLRAEQIEEAELHREAFSIAPADESAIRSAKRRVCVGTTSVRSVESAWRGVSGETGLFIYPGFTFQATNAMLTNFHLPKSSLLVLVCAFAGTQLVLDAYRHAVEVGYRFYSYGDCMLIL